MAVPRVEDATDHLSPKGCDTASHRTGEPSACASPWFEIRPAAPEELPAVFEAWVGTYKRSRTAGCIPNHLFESVQLATITGLLQRGARVDVLCAREAPAVVLAWVCWEHDKRAAAPIVHYAFTRDGIRERGYMTLLLKAIGATGRFLCTHETSFMKYLRGAVHNPGPARRKHL
jgi:hypothetical protein